VAGMLGLFGGSDGLRPQVKAAIKQRFGLTDEAIGGLRTVERKGKFAGRKVTYLRVFATAAAAAKGLQVRNFDDLDGSPALILYQGHEETDTQLVTLKGSEFPAS